MAGKHGTIPFANWSHFSTQKTANHFQIGLSISFFANMKDFDQEISAKIAESDYCSAGFGLKGSA